MHYCLALTRHHLLTHTQVLDPDLVEHNFRPLRSYPLPLWFKRWFVVAAMR